MKEILFIVIAFVSIQGYSQTKRIRILKADNTHADPRYPGATISMGNVFVQHEGATLRCDKAYIFQETKMIKAMGNVIMNQGDTIMQYSKYVDYNAETKIATSWGDVVLKDPLMELKTDTLRFDREKQQLYYKTGGTIKDTTNVLSSRTGYYYLQTGKFQAQRDVKVVNEDSELITNHLDYNTNTGIADLTGPSTITGEAYEMYTESGHHNSKTNISHFLKNSKIFYDDRTIEGDSLYYNKDRGFASATGHIKVIDTLNNSLVKGGYAEMFKEKDSVFITDKAIAISAVENDSLFIHGDILVITGKPEERKIRAYHHVKFFRTDLQGKCDSLVSNEKTGITKMLRNPVIWAEGNQISGDTIHLISNNKTEKLDSIKIWNNALMVKKDSAGFSQLKGRNMYGKFKDNALIWLNTVGNSESLFFIRNDQEELVGIDKKLCSKNIFVALEDKEVSYIDYFDSIEGKMYPPSEFETLPDQEKKFKGFIWREKERPKNKEAIFIHDEDLLTTDKNTDKVKLKESSGN